MVPIRQLSHGHKMTRKPVTFLMPVKNGASFLDISLHGLSQSCSSLDEIVIVDDKSTDGTSDILMRWASTQPNARIFTNPGVGLVDALNFGISIAQHEWIARFDVDDVYETNRIDQQMSMVQDSTVAVFSDYLNQSSDGVDLGIIKTAIRPVYTDFSIISGQRLAHSSVIYLKRAVQEVGMYKSEDYPAEDLGLWFRLISIGTFASYPKPLLKYRLSGNSITSLKQVEMQVQRDRIIANGLSALHKVAKQLSANPIKIYYEYKTCDDARERRLLCYRDLMIARRSRVIPVSKYIIVCLGLFLEVMHPQSWKILSRLQRERVRRQNYRFS
jgi:glycosyltransferase involved in cell wall biosynthesis